MIPIVSIVGKSDIGKTTLIEKLLPELTGRGYRVATVKHDVHGFEVDREGKDSWRHKKAGAHTVVISSPQKIALIRDVEKDLTLEEVRGKRNAYPEFQEGYMKALEGILNSARSGDGPRITPRARREKEVIVFSATGTHSMEFVEDVNRFNVAMTSARRKLIVVGNSGSLGLRRGLLGQYLEHAVSIQCIYRYSDGAVRVLESLPLLSLRR